MGGRGKRKRDAFEVVPAGFAVTGGSHARGRGHGGGRGVHHNTLRQAHAGAMKKSDEIWFRKCGHGERLWSDYYRVAGSPVPLEEWDAFVKVMKTKLPVTFRFRQGADPKERAHLESQLHALGSVAPVPWAPESAGVWQAATDKRTLAQAARQTEGGHSGDSALAIALAEGVAAGLLNRQELVSMLPVMALRPPVGGCVLDMCASPGQKTIQLLEAVTGGGGSDGREGMVVANDAHPKRVQALLGALSRHARPASERSRLVVVCHRGEDFPRPSRPFRKKSSAAADPAADSAADSSGAVGFDRVLADVPCSGDGTVRKDPTVLPRWTPAVGTQLHSAQLEIAWRGLQLLAVGGVMCYSTCVQQSTPTLL